MRRLIHLLSCLSINYEAKPCCKPLEDGINNHIMPLLLTLLAGEVRTPVTMVTIHIKDGDVLRGHTN